MATFVSISALKAFSDLNEKRRGVEVKIENLIVMINDLNKEDPQLRRFRTLDRKVESALIDYESVNQNVIAHCIKKSVDTLSDTNFLADQRQYTERLDRLEATRDSFLTVLEVKGLLQVEAPDQGAPTAGVSDLSDVLMKIADTQLKVHDSLLHKAKLPEQRQPFFEPKGTRADYLNFKNFKRAFEAFTRNVKTGADKLLFLQGSCKGLALTQISHFTLTDDNYNLALDRLSKEYLNMDEIQDSILEFLVNHRHVTCDKNYDSFRATMIKIQNYLEELKGSHGLDLMEGDASLLIRFIVFDRLPLLIKDQLYIICKTSRPSLLQVLEHTGEAIRRLHTLKKLSLSDESDKRTHRPPKADLPASTIALLEDKPRKDARSGGLSKPKGGKKKRSCMFCGEFGHISSLCQKFPSVADRKLAYRRVNGIEACGRCLFKVHEGACKSTCTDSQCKAPETHGILACPIRLQKSKGGSFTQGCLASINGPTYARTNRAVALQSLQLMAVSGVPLDDSERVVSVLLDTGAQRSVITKEAVNRLHLVPLRVENTALIGFGQSRGRNKCYDVVEVQLSKGVSGPSVVVSAIVVDALNQVSMTGICNIAKKIARSGVPLADPRLLNFKTDTLDFDLMVDNDHYLKFLDTRVHPRKHFGMFVINSWWGGILSGPIPGSTRVALGDVLNTVTMLNVSVGCPSILAKLGSSDKFGCLEVAKELNSYDSLGIRLESRADQDERATQSFKSSVYRNPVTKQFVVGFPWLTGVPPLDLPDNYFLVLNMFKSLMRQLDKTPHKRDLYKEVHVSEVNNSFIELVPENELNDPSIRKHFLMHFPVFRDSPGVSTPVRRVFDGSLRQPGSLSLNDCMLTGQLLTPHILRVLMRIRMKEYLLSMDISKAFLRVLLQIADRNFTCFFSRSRWEDPSSPILVWRFRSVLFGSTSSPFLLNATIAELLNVHKFNHCLEIYVDNLFCGASSLEEINAAAEEAIEIFGQAAMPLHEFCSNSTRVNQEFLLKGLFTKSDESLKTLGYRWHFKDDTWSVNEPNFVLDSVTKRSMLANVASIFDPLGLITPVSLPGRVLVQKAWSYGFSWDDPIPDDMKLRWLEIVDSIQLSLKLRHNRFIGFEAGSDVTLHCFSDASEVALGCVLYLVGNGVSVMFASKGKVCPVKMECFTVPRKELTALCLAVRFIRFVVTALTDYISFKSLHAWCDSTTALVWSVCRKPHKEIYIRHRVNEMSKVVDEFGIKLHYILTYNNPADLITKYQPDALVCKLWCEGPPILRHQAQWLVYQPPRAKVDCVPVYLGSVSISPDEYSVGLPSIKNISDLPEVFSKTTRAVVLAKGQVLSSRHIHLARLIWYREVQSKYYLDVVQFLSDINNENTRSLQGKKLIRSKKLIVPDICVNLNLFLDADKVIRLFTSLLNSGNLSYDQKFPVLLPRRDHFTYLVIKDCHARCGHSGLMATLNTLRSSFWIPKCGKSVGSVIKACAKCKLLRGDRYHVPQSPPLPFHRVADADPFSYVGCDMSGHFFVRDGTDAVKCFLFIFTCATSRACHVEVSPDASAKSFCNAFLRMVGRKGTPLLIISDQGSNLKAFAKALVDISDTALVRNTLIDHGVQWKFIPSHAPFMGGQWERILGCLKNVIRKAVGKKLLSRDEFRTVVAYAEAVVNDRPMTYVSQADHDFVPLTPNVLLYGRNLRFDMRGIGEVDLNDPSYKFGSHGTLNIMCKRLKSTLIQVRKLWVQDYFAALREKDALRNRGSPASKYILEAQPGDVCLVAGDNHTFRLGRILELIPSEDGLVRSARVQTKGGSGIHALVNLRHLESAPLSTASAALDDVPSKRPRRQAAAAAQRKWLATNLVSISL